ncbi:glycerate kinase [Klebsiella pneumoniae]|uniref:Glycerate kinase n=1 Tax=Klebsiella pneumoniae TaxID=573 RepID=A0A447RH53_KLEPN|nr:glycerate kinase [Klebsiella pneumoniae]
MAASVLPRPLGARFWRKDGTLLPAPAAGQDLAHIQRIDLSGLDPRLQQSEIQASCDVTNPLLGEHGATWVYGAQKGADEAALCELEAGMAHYSQLLTQTLRIRRQRTARRRGRGRYGGCAYRLYRRHAASGH